MTETLRADEPERDAKPAWDLERVRAIWNRRWWLALPLFLLPLVGGTALVFALPNLYRSTATVLIERQQVPESFVRPTVTSELDTRLQTISQEILSRSRLQSLIDKFNLYADLRKQLPSEEVVQRLRQDIQLELRATDRGRAATIAFAISYKGLDPQTVAIVANTLASFYIEENLKARERQATGTAEFLKAQINETKKRLDQQEQMVSDFRKRYLGELPQQMQGNLATLEALGNQLRVNSDSQVRASERRATIAAQLTDAETMADQQQMQQLQLRQYQQQLTATGSPGAAIVAPPLPAAAYLARLRQDLTAAQTRYTDAHPTVVRLKAEIATVERELEHAEAAGAKSKPDAKGDAKAAPGTPAPSVAPPASPYVLRLRESLQAAEAEIKILKAEDARLRAAIATYQSRVEHTPRREQEFLEISRDYEATKEQHASLTKRYGEAQLAESMEQRQKGEQFRLLDPAVPSPQPAAPNRQRLLFMILALSAGLAGGAVVLAEVLDTSFHSVQQMKTVTTLPVLVSIGHIATDAERRRRRLGLRLAAASGLLGLVLVAGASYFVAHGNEKLVRTLADRG